MILRVDRTEGLKVVSVWTALLARGFTAGAAGRGTAGLISEDRDDFTYTQRERERERQRQRQRERERHRETERERDGSLGCTASTPATWPKSQDYS